MADKPRTVALYARVSTDDQTVDNQLLELRAVAARHGWTVAAEYIDDGISGSKGRDKRPGLDALLKAVASRQFDMVLSWSVDRLGRSLAHLLDILGELDAKQIGLYLHQQQVDTSTPAGRALFQMVGVFAQFERSMIQERVKAGLQRAKAHGKRLGRPQVASETEDAVRALRATGMGMLKIARQVGIGTSVVQRIVREN